MRASSVFYVRLAIAVSKYFLFAALATAPLTAASAATEVGGIPGSFAVSPTGAATYNIPISMPPGVAGMAPHLALTYNSQSGNGLAGYGWTLSGLSVITVCPWTLADDGMSESADFTGSGNGANKFCLDGARLKTTSGADGANGTQYRKAIDDFSQITSYRSGGTGPAPTSGPQYFTVQTPDGVTYEYGATTTSEIVASGPGVPSGVTVVRAWALDKIYDKFGNSIVFNYILDNADGDFWPSSIGYTLHNGAAGSNRIVFSYDDLNSINPGLYSRGYIGGAQVGQMKRLNEIDVQYNSVTTFAYTLQYYTTLSDSAGNPGTERSLLKTVTQCAGSTCYPPTNINWQQDTSGWQGTVYHAPTGGQPALTAAEAAAILMVDVNGDGMADVIYPVFAGTPSSCTSTGDWMMMLAGPNSYGPTAPQDTGVPSDCYSQYAMPIDLTNSGLQGWLVPGKSGSGVDWFVITPHLSNGVLSFTRSDTHLGASGYDSGNATVFDYNGDGLADIVYSDGANIRWYKNKGDGTFYPQHLIESGAFSSTPDGITQFLSSWGGSAGGFDGTSTGGFMALSINESTQVPTWFLQQAGDTATATGSPNTFGSFKGTAADTVVPMFIDLNGDGLSDVLYADTYAYPTPGILDVFTSSGANFFGGETSAVMNIGFMLDRVAADYAGNGRQSALFGVLDANGNCTGIGKIGNVQGALQSATLSGMDGEGPCASGYMKGSFRTADVDGDGLDDLLWVANGLVYHVLHSGNTPDLVIQITNDFSQTYTVNYAPLSDGALYTEGTSPSGNLTLGPGGYQSYPQLERSYTGPMSVVTSYAFYTGVTGTPTDRATDSFIYADALINLGGRGFEGFGDVMTTDPRLHGAGDTAGTTVDTTYNQSFPFTGTVATQTHWTNGHSNIESFVQNSYLTLPTTGDAQYMYVGTSTAENYELGAGSTTGATPTTKTTTITTPKIPAGVMISLDVKRTTYAGSSTTPTLTSDTNTSFDTDTTNWCLLLPGGTSGTPAGVTVTNTDGATGVQSVRTTDYDENTANCRETDEYSTESISGQKLTKAFIYDAYGHVFTTSITGLTGTNNDIRTTTYGYDPTNEFVASIKNTLSETANQTWDPTLGVVLTATDPNGVETQFKYDLFGLKTQEANVSDGTYVKWCYGLQSGDCGVSTSLTNTKYWTVATHYSGTNQAGASGTTIYDSFGRPLQSTGTLLGGTQTNVRTTYDRLGRISATSTPYTTAPTTWTNTAYDSLDRPLTVSSPPGATSGCATACVTQYGYNGLTTSVTDPKGIVTSSMVDASGRIQSVTNDFGGPKQATTSYTYYPFGELHQTTDAAQNVTTLSYDSWGRKTGMVDPDMGSWSYGYDAFGELTSQTDAKGQNIVMAYDDLGRLISKTVPGETGSDTWCYDGQTYVAGTGCTGNPAAPFIGKLSSMQSGDGNYSRAYQYDSATGKPVEVDADILGTTYTTNTSYDSFGRVANITYPNEPMPVSDDAPVAVAAVTSNPSGQYYPQVGQTITLDGSQSNDPDNGPQPLNYTWAQVEPAPAGSQPIVGLPATSTSSNFSFTTNTAGTYNFTLTTSDSVLTSSAVTSVTVYPQAIANLQGTEANASNGKINLTWTPHTGDGPYSIQQSTNGGAFAPLQGTYPEPTGILGFANGTYQFEVQSCSNGACTAWSAPVTVTMLRTPSVPATPTLASANPSTNGQARITWTAPAGTITFYKVFTSTNGGAYNSGTNVGNVHSYTITGLTSPNSYTFEVEACNTVNGADDCSARSAGVTVTVDAPGVPWAPNLNGPSSAPLHSQVSLTWSNNGGTVTSWTLQRNILGTVTTLYTGTATSYTASLTTDNTYLFEVKACNSYGCSAWAGLDVTATGGNNNVVMPVQTPTQAPAPTTGGGSAFVVPAIPAPDSLMPAQLVAATTPPDVDIHSRVTAQRELGLRRQKAEIDRAQYRRDHALADRDFDPRSPGNTLYAAQMMGQGAADPTQGGNQFRSVQDEVVAGVVKATALAPRKLMVGTTSRFSVNYVYDANENLTQVVNAANTSLIYWEGTATDAFGHITTEILGNGIVTGRTYDPNTGALQEEASGVGSNPAVADRVYTWDADGNLNTRQDNVKGLTETFTYDTLNRVSTAAVTGGSANSTLTMGYDAVGNIMSKTDPNTGADMGAYTYDATHPMEIAYITPSSGPVRNFQYDNSNGAAGDGNLVNDGIRTYAWDAENRPTAITNTQTNVTTNFAYSPDGMRYYESTPGGSDPNSLLEVNGLFQVYTEGGHSSYRNSIAAPTGIVAIYTVRDDSLVTTRYLTTDHLGSSSEIANEVGVVTEAMSYDVFGAKRDPNTWQTYAFGAAPGSTDITDKGYTGQQQLDALGLIHMNARALDPYVGRFVSADSLSGGNRFAYVGNNPLAFTDPSGYCHVSLAGFGFGGGQDCTQTVVNKTPGLKATVRDIGRFGGDLGDHLSHIGLVLQNHTNEIISLIIAYETAGLCDECGPVLEGAIGGGTFAGSDTALNGGNGTQILEATGRGAFAGGVAGGAFYYADSFGTLATQGGGLGGFDAYYQPTFGDYAMSYGGYALAGGISARAAGGNFVRGAEFSMLMYTAQLTYQNYVNGQSASIYPGRGSILKQKSDVGDEFEDVNNWGPAQDTDDPSLVGSPIVQPDCNFCEGGSGSVAMDNLPVMQATATFHDAIGDRFEAWYGSYTSWFNVGTYIPAYSLSSAAVTVSSGGAAIFAGGVSRNETGGP